MIRRAAWILGSISCIGFMLVLIAGFVLSKPATHPIGPAPSDLQATSVVIPTTNGNFVKGWLVPGRSGGGVLLLLHGVRSDRTQMIARARFLKKAGSTSLLIDLPAHGESSGDRITFGARESIGVRASLAYLRKSFPQERIGAIGVSLGAASLVLSHPRPTLDAVVLESMYPTIRDATQDRIAIRFGPAGKALAPLLLWQLPMQIGVSSDALRPISNIASLGSPVLIASGDIDRHTTPEETRRIYAAARNPKVLWLVPGAAHVDLYRFAPAKYEQTTMGFLLAALQPMPAQAARAPDRMLWPNRSLERSVPAPRAVPAVPLIGCTACTSINGRIAAAQFNR